MSSTATGFIPGRSGNPARVRTVGLDTRGDVGARILAPRRQTR